MRQEQHNTHISLIPIFNISTLLQCYITIVSPHLTHIAQDLVRELPSGAKWRRWETEESWEMINGILGDTLLPFADHPRIK